MNRSQEAGETGHRTPVLIVGGSLVGLSMSVFLGRLGVPHTLVERHPGTSIHPRGRGNNVRTMELFRVAGVEQQIKEVASVLADNHGIMQTPSLADGDGEWLFKEIDPGAAWPGSAPADGASAARTTSSRCCWPTPANSAAICASRPS